MITGFDDALQQAGGAVTGHVEWYPGTEHGFAFAERPTYVRDASEQHWERLHDLFARQLRPS